MGQDMGARTLHEWLTLLEERHREAPIQLGLERVVQVRDAMGLASTAVIITVAVAFVSIVVGVLSSGTDTPPSGPTSSRRFAYPPRPAPRNCPPFWAITTWAVSPPSCARKTPPPPMRSSSPA